MSNESPTKPTSFPSNHTLPPLSAVMLGFASLATVVVSFVVGAILLFVFAKSGGRRGPGDTGPLGLFLLVLVVVPVSALLGSVTSFAGLKVDRRPGRRRWFKVLFCFHIVIIALGLAYFVFCNIY